jgi:hypothetical protein
MAFRDDERAQSVVIGSLLIFAILIISFSSYQAFVVPQENRGVEIDHFQETEDSFSEFRNNIVNAVGTDESRSTSLRLGTRYPTRAIALNPPPAAGRLETTGAGEVEVTGAGTVGDVCRADGGTPTTRSLVYTPSYNEYDEPKGIGYESRVVSREFRGGSVYDQRLVRSTNGADQISLSLLTGEVSENGVESYVLEVNGSNRYSTTITNPTITIPSRFNATQWDGDILEGRSDIDATDVNGGDRVELDFDGGDYTVTCAVFGLDSAPAFTPPDSGGGGGGNDVGTGGTERWDTGTTSRRISTQGGVWTGIGVVDSVVLSNPRLSPIKASGDPVAGERYLRLAVTVGDPPSGDRRFVFVIPQASSGFAFTWDQSDRRFEFSGNKKIRIYEEDAATDDAPQSVFDNELKTSVVNDWYLNDTDLNLLDPGSYEGIDQDGGETLKTIRNYLNNTGQEAFINDAEGRVNLTIEDRGISPDRSSEFQNVEVEASDVNGQNANSVTVTYSTTDDSGVNEIQFDAFKNDANGKRLAEDSAGPADSPYTVDLNEQVNTLRDDIYVRVTLVPNSGTDQVCTGTITTTVESVTLDCRM